MTKKETNKTLISNNLPITLAILTFIKKRRAISLLKNYLVIVKIESTGKRLAR